MFAFTDSGCIITCSYPSCSLLVATRSLCWNHDVSSCLSCLCVTPCGLQSSGKADSERAAHAMADPEIQMILTDPMVRQVLTDFKENPQHAQKVSPMPGNRHIRALRCALHTSTELFSHALTVTVSIAVGCRRTLILLCAFTAIGVANPAQALTRNVSKAKGGSSPA